jgi:6-phosphogluconate dehydrogenase (decarboxylating)
MMKYHVKDELLWKKIDDEVVIVDPENDDYCYLNTTGSEIWEMLAAGKSIESVIEALGEQYEEKDVAIETSVRALVKELIEAHLLKETK